MVDYNAIILVVIVAAVVVLAITFAIIKAVKK